MEHQLAAWSSSKKVAFRFAFIFILGYIFLKNNGAYPLFELVNKPINALFKTFTPWFSRKILHYYYDYNIFTNGSGDTSYDWVSLLILVILAVLGATLWSVLDRHRKSYNTLYYWLTVAIRYYIAFMLINYGSIKLIHAQMPPPNLYRLMEPLHEFSPMGLAWTYLGYSKAYNIFMGIVEMMAALLLFRRTLVIGALITMATSINIMTVNYFFDVPVKMLSTALFLLSLFLLLPYIKTLFTFFLGNKARTLQPLSRPVYRRKFINKTLSWIKYILILLYALLLVSKLYNSKKMMAQFYKKSALHGIYKIEKKSSSDTTIPNDWSYIILEYEGSAMIRDRFYNRVLDEIPIDTVKKEIKINNYILNYSVEYNGDIVLTKELSDKVETTKLIKQKVEQMELMKGKFRFIQEYPNNR